MTPIPGNCCGGGDVGPITVEACCAETNASLEILISEVDQVEELLVSIDASVDGLEACCAETNTNLTTLIAEVDQVEELLTQIESNTDGLEACCAETNANLVIIQGYLDAVEGQLTTIIGHVDGIEALLTTITGQITTLIGHVDGIEVLITATNAALATIITHVDGIEAKLDSLIVLNQPVATFAHGQLDVTAVAVQLPSNAALRGLIVKAHKLNTDDVYIGNSAGVTTLTGFQLSASETLSLPVDNTDDVWAISASGTQRLDWIVT